MTALIPDRPAPLAPAPAPRVIDRPADARPGDRLIVVTKGACTIRLEEHDGTEAKKALNTDSPPLLVRAGVAFALAYDLVDSAVAVVNAVDREDDGFDERVVIKDGAAWRVATPKAAMPKPRQLGNPFALMRAMSRISEKEGELAKLRRDRDAIDAAITKVEVVLEAARRDFEQSKSVA
jgi:hypothetical protein